LPCVTSPEKYGKTVTISAGKLLTTKKIFSMSKRLIIRILDTDFRSCALHKTAQSADKVKKNLTILYAIQKKELPLPPKFS
jgi:hypothetical protein